MSAGARAHKNIGDLSFSSGLTVRQRRLPAKYGVRNAAPLGLCSMDRVRLRLSLTLHGFRDDLLSWAIGDALKGIGDARQIGGKLMRYSGVRQRNHSPAVKVQNSPERQTHQD